MSEEGQQWSRGDPQSGMMEEIASQDATSAPPKDTRERVNKPVAPERAGASGGKWHPTAPIFTKSFERPRWRPLKLDWRNEDAQFTYGRVLIIDYIRQDRVETGHLKIAAQEFNNIYSLEKFYKFRDRADQAALRLIHVQNAPWATKFLIRKYNVSARDELVGTDFGRWAAFEKPEFRAGKPFLKSRTWGTQRDPWRNIRRTAFSLDYLKHYPAKDCVWPEQGDGGNNLKMFELNAYNDDGGPCYTWGVYVQRLSVYIQHVDEDAPTPPDDVENPYKQFSSTGDKYHQTQNGSADPRYTNLPRLEDMDNGSAIIIFENCQSQSINDTLISPRDEYESRWRRLTFYLPRDESSTDDRVALECMDQIIQDVFKGVAYNWYKFLNVTETHVSVLEDKIYESPADETRAPELWTNSSQWLKVEKLASMHIDCLHEMGSRLSELTDETPASGRWLNNLPEEFDRVANLIQEDLVKPTDSLNDLLYKSVEIRDSRHSLQLNTSLWRLSWITFIFLPLTFVVGFFGMNVDTFDSNPSIKWYFLAAVCLMLFVLVLWYLVKHWIEGRRYTPYQRGIFEHLFHDLAVDHPDLWTRAGPRDQVQPVGFFSSVKWRLLIFWFDPKKTINRKPADPDEDAGGSGLGVWARTKRTLARRWLNSIDFERRPSISAAEQGRVDTVAESVAEQGGAVTELAALSLPVAATEAQAEVQPVTVENLERLHPQFAHWQSRLDTGTQRPSTIPRPSSSGGSSGLMVEDWDGKDEGPELTHPQKPLKGNFYGDIRSHYDGHLGLV